MTTPPRRVAAAAWPTAEYKLPGYVDDRAINRVITFITRRR